VEGTVQASTIIAGSYRLLNEIGNDSLGTLFRAETLDGGTVVSVRLMDAELAADADRVAGFLEAGEAARAVSHANVAEVLAVGVDRVPYWVTRWAPGLTLDRILATRKLDVDVSCEIGLHLLAALAAAEEYGVLHQHLTPRDVVVDLENPAGVRTQVLNFGLNEKTLGLQRGLRAGLYDQHFLAPELLAGKPGDAAADIFSVGMILYELLSRLSGRSREDALLRPSRDLGELVRRNPGIPEPLVRSLAGAVCPMRQARIGSASEFARLLVPYVRPKVRHEDPARLNTLDPVLKDYSTMEASPSLMLIRAPRPRTDSACPEEMLLEPTFPRAPTAPRLEALHADVFGKRRAPTTVELETVEYAPAEQAPDSVAQPTDGVSRAAAFAIGAGFSVGAALAWLGTVI
jgi:serine/threonine protein kinase